jgi:hypothetical protein
MMVSGAVFRTHPIGTAIDMIWSRRRSDEAEIERLAVHYEVTRTAGACGDPGNGIGAFDRGQVGLPAWPC